MVPWKNKLENSQIMTVSELRKIPVFLKFSWIWKKISQTLQTLAKLIPSLNSNFRKFGSHFKTNVIMQIKSKFNLTMQMKFHYASTNFEVWSKNNRVNYRTALTRGQQKTHPNNNLTLIKPFLDFWFGSTTLCEKIKR